MIILLIFLLILLISQSIESFKIDDQGPMTQSSSYLDHNYHQSSFSKYGDQLPQNYTFQKTYELPVESVGYLNFSPDDKWIIYKSYFSSGYIFYRPRQSVKNYTKVLIGSLVKSWKFSKDQKFLFIGTSGQYFYTCKFSANMNADDCKATFDLEQNTTIYKIQPNSANQIVIEGVYKLWILNYTETGSLSLHKKLDLEKDRCDVYDVKWHPQVDNDALILGGQNFSSSYGYFMIYNISTGTFFNLSIGYKQYIHSFEFKDSQTLFSCSQFALQTYSFSLTSIKKIQTVIGKGCRYMQMSSDRSLLFVNFNQKYITPVTVYKVNQSSQANVTLKLHSQLFDVSYYYMYSFSSDGNEVLFAPFTNVTFFQRYSLCVNNTFYSNFQCHQCSSNCSLCHYNESYCLTCINSSYILTDGVCIKCSNVLPNCLSCVNQTYCQQCATYFYKDLNETCSLCDKAKTCINCIDSSICLKCDTNKGFMEDPINGICFCPSFFSYSNGECVLCGIKSCKSCIFENVCSECDQDTILEDGKCQEKSIGMIFLYVGIGLIVAFGGAFAVYKYKKVKRTKQSLLSNPNDMENEG